MKSRKYRLYPNNQQREQLQKNFGCVRFVYNWWLSLSQEKYSGYLLLAKQLTEKKKELLWLKDCYMNSLQHSLRNLDKAFQNFFKKRSKYPKFKKKSNSQSVYYIQSIKIVKDFIQTPKIWLIKCNFHRECKWKIKSMTITRTASWKYYVSILTDFVEQKPSNTTAVGIDLWIKTFAVCSDWQTFDNPRFLKKSIKKLKKQQRVLSRKDKWSNNRNKQRVIVARIYEKVKNQRQDFLHKASTTIANKYWVVAMEKLNIKGMKKNHCLAQSIGDVSRGMFKAFLQYKTTVKEIWVFDPSSKKCIQCWNIKKDLSLKHRVYHCDNCGYIEDRDLMASKNILAMANL